MSKVVAAVALVVIFAVACSSDGAPQSYSDQTDLREDGLSTVQANWMSGCEVGLGENLAEDANTICQCSYERLSAPDGIPFEDFVQLNNDLKSDPTMLIQSETPSKAQTDLIEIVKNCIAG